MLQHLVASSLLICAILAVRALFRGRVSNRLIYALWIVVFIRLVIPGFAFEIELPSRTLPDESVGWIQQDLFTQYDPIITPSVDGEVDVSIPHADSVTVSTPKADTSSSEKPDMIGILKTAYPFGVAAILLWVAVSELAIWAKLRRSRIFVKKEHGIRIFLSDSSISPCVFGIIPAVYLNTRTTDSEELELVTKHELAHIRQLDHIRLLCRRLLLALYWFDPFVWIYTVAAGRDAELACDEAVTAGLDERQRIRYARTILNYTPQANSSAAGFGGKPMKKRIMAITGTGKIKKLYVLLALIMSLTVCVLAFTGCVEGKAEATDDEVTESSMPESNDSSIDDGAIEWPAELLPEGFPKPEYTEIYSVDNKDGEVKIVLFGEYVPPKKADAIFFLEKLLKSGYVGYSDAETGNRIIVNKEGVSVEVYESRSWAGEHLTEINKNSPTGHTFEIKVTTNGNAPACLFWEFPDKSTDLGLEPMTFDEWPVEYLPDNFPIPGENVEILEMKQEKNGIFITLRGATSDLQEFAIKMDANMGYINTMNEPAMNANGDYLFIEWLDYTPNNMNDTFRLQICPPNDMIKK